MGWDRPLLPAAARLLADRYASDDTFDLSSVVVVLPGSRPGRRLKELLLDVAIENQKRLVPPRIVTAGRLPELFYDPQRPPVDPLASRMLWAAALRRVSQSQGLKAVFPDIPTDDDLRGWDRLAADVQRLHSEVARGGNRLEDVARIVGQSAMSGFTDVERWELLAEVEREYARLLAEAGRSDPQISRIEALQCRLELDVDLWLIALAELPRIARMMLESASARGVAVVHAPEELADSFDAFGCVRVDAWLDRQVVIPDDKLCIADRPGDQADLLLAEIAELDAGTSTEDVAIAVPDADLVPFIEQRLEAWDIPARYAAGTPISRTPTFTFLSAAAAYLQSGRRWEPFATLLRHPHLAHLIGPGAQAEAIAKADRFFRERLPARVPDELWPPLGRVRKRLHDLLEPLRSRRPLSEWGPVLVDVLATLYGDLVLDRNIPRERRLIDTLQAFRAAADALSRVPGAVDQSCEGSVALQLLLDSVGSVTIPEDPDRSAVELLGWLEMHLDDAPVAFITGFNEPFLPESVVSDAFLPDSLRSRLGLLDNDSRYARDAYHVMAIRHSRRTRWIAGRMTSGGDPLRPSRLMLAVRPDDLPSRVLSFADPKKGHPAPIVPARRVPGETSAFMLPPESHLEFEAPSELRVTAFRSLIENPYLYLLRGRYRLEAIDDRAREMDGGLFGGVAHSVLRDFSRSDAGNSTRHLEIEECLDELLNAEVRRRFGETGMLPAVLVQVEQLRRRLRAFARWQAEWASDGWETVLVEGRPASETGDDRTFRVQFPVDDEPIILRGRIDRVDRHAVSGRYAVLDYKTSDSGDPPEKTHRKGRKDAKRWVDLQLPLYRHLLTLNGAHGEAPHITGLEAEILDLGYIVLPRATASTGVLLADWTLDDLDDADATACDIVRALRTGRIAYDSEAKASFLDGRTSALLGLRQLVVSDDQNEEDE